MSNWPTKPQRRYLEAIRDSRELPPRYSRGARGNRTMMLDRLEGFGWIEPLCIPGATRTHKHALTELGRNALEGKTPT